MVQPGHRLSFRPVDRVPVEPMSTALVLSGLGESLGFHALKSLLARFLVAGQNRASKKLVQDTADKMTIRLLSRPLVMYGNKKPILLSWVIATKPGGDSPALTAENGRHRPCRRSACPRLITTRCARPAAIAGLVTSVSSCGSCVYSVIRRYLIPSAPFATSSVRAAMMKSLRCRPFIEWLHQVTVTLPHSVSSPG